MDSDSRALLVSVTGGLGGHSGTNIEDGHSNAIKVLGRALREAGEAVPFRLASLEGGKSRNAIPRDANAVIVVAAAQEAALRDAIAASVATIQKAYATSDAGSPCRSAKPRSQPTPGRRRRPRGSSTASPSCPRARSP